MPEVPVQTKVPQVAATSSSFNWKKVLVVVLLGAALIAIVVGVYYFLYGFQPVTTTNNQIEIKSATPSTKPATPSAQKDETFGWVTLTNTNIGYSVRYPSSWKTKRCTYPEENNSTSDLIDPTRVEYTTGDVCASGLSNAILIIIGRRPKNYNQELAEWEQYYSSAEHSNYKKTNVTVGGLNAVKISAITTDQNLTFGKKAGVVLFRYLINDGKDKPLAIWYTQDTTDDNYQSIFDKILTTFKFL